MSKTSGVPRFGTSRRLPAWGATALTLLVAFSVRLLVLGQTSSVPSARHLIGDAAAYYEWARRITAGDWIGAESFYQAPLYPYVLAAWFTIAGDAPWLIGVLQAAWGTAACVMLGLAAARMFDPRVGALAGVLLALYGPAVFFDAIIQKTSLSNTLICAALALLASAGRRLSVGRCAALGATVSLLALTRENGMIWHIVLPAWIVFGEAMGKCVAHENGASRTDCGKRGGAAEGARGRAARVAGYALGAAVILVPVGVRNACVGGEFALTTFQAGPNFYIGNSREADGRYRPLVRGHETPEFERRDATQLAQKVVGRTMTPGEVSWYWLTRAWEDIRTDPGRWLGLLGYKVLLVANRYEVSDVESLRVYCDASPLLGALNIVWHFGVLAPLALLGAAATWPRRRSLWVYYALIVSMSAAVVAFYVLARYRFPLVPLLVPFAAAGCVFAWDALRARRFAELLVPAVLAISSALVVNWPVQDERRLDALAEMNAGVALAEAGDLKNASEYFRRAVECNPQSAEANNNLAQALALQGAFAEAVGYYRAALAAERDLAGARYNLGVALEQVGRIAEAKGEYELAVRQDPTDDAARAALERLSERTP